MISEILKNSESSALKEDTKKKEEKEKEGKEKRRYDHLKRNVEDCWRNVQEMLRRRSQDGKYWCNDFMEDSDEYGCFENKLFDAKIANCPASINVFWQIDWNHGGTEDYDPNPKKYINISWSRNHANALNDQYNFWCQLQMNVEKFKKDEQDAKILKEAEERRALKERARKAYPSLKERMLAASKLGDCEAKCDGELFPFFKEWLIEEDANIVVFCEYVGGHGAEFSHKITWRRRRFYDSWLNWN